MDEIIPRLEDQLPDLFDNNDFVMAGVNVELPLYTGGRLSSQIAAAESGGVAREAAAGISRADLRFDVAERYVAVQRAERAELLRIPGVGPRGATAIVAAYELLTGLHRLRRIGLGCRGGRGPSRRRVAHGSGRGRRRHGAFLAEDRHVQRGQDHQRQDAAGIHDGGKARYAHACEPHHRRRQDFRPCSR